MIIDLLKEVAGTRICQDGQIIIHDGEKMGDEMYVLLSGTAGIYKNYGEPNEVKLAELEPGTFFGEMTLFLHKERTATVVAHGPGMVSTASLPTKSILA